MKRRFFTIASRPIEAENNEKAMDIFMEELKMNGVEDREQFRSCEIVVKPVFKSQEEKLMNMIMAEEDTYAEIRAELENTLVEHGWTKVEYRDWNILKKDGVEVTTRTKDFDIASGIFQSRCDYDGLELEENGFHYNDINCWYDGWKRLPEETLSDTVSKDELRQWIADERELREGEEGAEIVLGHCEENWSLKE